MPWRDTGKEGVRQKVVREDRAAGHFLGLIAFEPLTRSGLHQHQGPASSYFMDGALTDYWQTMSQNRVGINLKGATHDAIAFCKTLLMARLEAPVLYPPGDGPLHDLHVGARHGAFENPAPDAPADLDIDPMAIRPVSPGVPGVLRRMPFDYQGTGSDHRMVMLQLRPGTVLPPLATSALTEFWVLGGGLTVGGKTVLANGFVVVEPDSQAQIASPFGAQVIAWAEGPTRFEDGAPELFGF